MSEKLVLWKPRPQRMAESFMIPLVLFPVGPVSRALLGDSYSPFYGLAIVFPLMFLTTLIGRRWALAHGGEWVTAAERLQRLLAEMTTIPRWQTALVNAALYALIISAVFLAIVPASDLDDLLGGPVVTFGFIGLVSLLGVIPILTGRYRRLASVTVDPSQTPPRELFSEWLRLIPRGYLASMLATAGGVLVGLKLDENFRIMGFVIVALLLQQLLRFLPFFGSLPRRLYPSFANSRFWVFLFFGVMCWGIPFAILFSGFVIIQAAGQPTLIASGIGVTLGLSILGGLAMGAWMYLVNRATQKRSA
jgi:hypothetical protein